MREGFSTDEGLDDNSAKATALAMFSPVQGQQADSGFTSAISQAGFSH